MYKFIEDDDSKSNEEEVIGDPWTILPVKTRKYAKECIEIVLSKRHITKLINFHKLLFFLAFLHWVYSMDHYIL